MGLAMVASACGGGDSDTEAAADPDRPESFEDIEWESPLGEFLGWDTSVDFSSDDAQAEEAEKQRQVEELTAACMREEGFEYTPVDYSQFQGFSDVDEEFPWGSRAWTEKYGFGITTQRFAQSEVGPDLVGYDDSQFESIDEEFVDPNQEYVESLSEAEQQAYYEVLYGEEPEIPEGATEEEMDAIYQDFQPSGCNNEAFEEVYDFNGAGGDEFYNEFGEELDALYERLESDPRVVDYRAQVSACVSEKGFEYTNMESLYEYFESKMTGIGYQFSEQDPLIEAGLDPTTMTDEAIDEFYQNLNQLDDEDRAALTELQAEELGMAAAVDECGGGMLDEQLFMSDIRVEMEQAFLDENMDRLSEYEGSQG